MLNWMPNKLLATLMVLSLWPVGGGRAAAQGGQLEFSCRTFPANLSEAALIRRYGAANVKSAPVVGEDDGPQDGTVVFPTGLT
jgi:hypothetical protein